MSNALEKFIATFLKEHIGIYNVSRFDAFESAFTHSSYKNVCPDSVDYERLEILGDSLITLIITENLYSHRRSLKEISTLRKEIISGSSLCHMSRELELDKYIRVDKGCKISDSVLEDVYEAFMGALYLNIGYEKTKKIIEDTLYKNYLTGKLVFEVDYKTRLQEKVQSLFKKNKLVYAVERRYKDGEGREVFAVSVRLGERILGAGEGHRKKVAEQRSAQEALIKLERS